MEKEKISEQWVGMEGRLKVAMKEVEEMRKGEKGRSGWWDEECWEEKRGVRRKLREEKWKRRRGV